MKYYVNAFKKMTDFKGRTSRKEYWIFYLINFLIFALICLVGVFLLYVSPPEIQLNIAVLVFFVFFAYSAVLIIPSVSIAIRRLHDAGFSGWWFLVNFIPYIGSWVLIVLMLFPSKIGDNQYGPNPYGKNLDINSEE